MVNTFIVVSTVSALLVLNPCNWWEAVPLLGAEPAPSLRCSEIHVMWSSYEMLTKKPNRVLLAHH